MVSVTTAAKCVSLLQTVDISFGRASPLGTETATRDAGGFRECGQRQLAQWRASCKEIVFWIDAVRRVLLVYLYTAVVGGDERPSALSSV